tara:strand:- start:24 stop:152 length:129 start_codon:yes stop_codon:yes gene_type:complete
MQPQAKSPGWKQLIPREDLEYILEEAFSLFGESGDGFVQFSG